MYRDAGPGFHLNRLQTVDRFLSRLLFVLVRFWPYVLALPRERYAFLKKHSYVSCSYLIELMFKIMKRQKRKI